MGTGTWLRLGTHLELEGGLGAGAGVLPGQLHGAGELVLGVCRPAAKEGDAGGLAPPPAIRVGVEHVLQHWRERDWRDAGGPLRPPGGLPSPRPATGPPPAHRGGGCSWPDWPCS